MSGPHATPAAADAKPCCCSTKPVDEAGPKAIDPVCGMPVDPATSGHSREHAGTVYHFCRAACAERFASDPVGYLESGPDAPLPVARRSSGYFCPMCPDVQSAVPAACPSCVSYLPSIMSSNYGVYCLPKALENGRQRICQLPHSRNNPRPLGSPSAYNHSPLLGATKSAVIYISVIVLCSHLSAGFRDTLNHRLVAF